MLRRRVLGPAVALAAALALAACTPEAAEPTPTPTALSEEEAYAAAEDAFRAYIDALNRIDVADSETFEPAFALTTGRQNSFDREQYSFWHAEGWEESGDVIIQSLSNPPTQEDLPVIRLDVCLDTSGVGLVDETGASRKNPDALDTAVWGALMTADRDSDWKVESLFLPDSPVPC